MQALIGWRERLQLYYTAEWGAILFPLLFQGCLSCAMLVIHECRGDGSLNICQYMLWQPEVEVNVLPGS